jgi:hypothetical protein
MAWLGATLMLRALRLRRRRARQRREWLKDATASAAADVKKSTEERA